MGPCGLPLLLADAMQCQALSAHMPCSSWSFWTCPHPRGRQWCTQRACFGDPISDLKSIWLNLCPSVIDVLIREVTLGQCAVPEKLVWEIFFLNTSQPHCYIGVYDYIFFNKTKCWRENKILWNSSRPRPSIQMKWKLEPMRTNSGLIQLSTDNSCAISFFLLVSFNDNDSKW